MRSSWLSWLGARTLRRIAPTSPRPRSAARRCVADLPCGAECTTRFRNSFSQPAPAAFLGLTCENGLKSVESRSQAPDVEPAYSEPRQPQQESEKFADKFGWQQGGEDGRGRGLLDEFKRRQASGEIKELGYDEACTPRSG